jgi:hypothetical protein
MIIGNRIINHTNVQMFQTRFNTIIILADGMDKMEFIGKCDNEMIDGVWALMAQMLED